MEAESAYVLCHTDGRIVAGNVVWERWLMESGAVDQTLAATAAQLACPALCEGFQQFCAGTAALAAFPVKMRGRARQLRLQRLGDLILLEIGLAEVAESELAQLGRLTARLIHDFKNQLGGLKLYAAYLKKLLAQAEAAEARAESQEIAGKIIASLDTLAEHATLVSKLARPVELRVELGDLVALVEQLIAAQAQYANERGVTLASKLAEDLPESQFDPQQLRAALQTLFGRAIAVTLVGSAVKVELQNHAGGGVLQISDQGPTLDAAQRQTFFELLTTERLNKTALDLALAKRIIDAHGGTVEVGKAEPSGTVVRVKLKAVKG